MQQHPVARFEQRQVTPASDDVPGEAAGAGDILRQPRPGLAPARGIERADADRPQLGHEDGAGGDLGAGVGDRYVVTPRDLGVLDTGYDETVLGEHRAAELRDHLELAGERAGATWRRTAA